MDTRRQLHNQKPQMWSFECQEKTQMEPCEVTEVRYREKGNVYGGVEEVEPTLSLVKPC